MKLQYAPALDGLRAVAVLMVVGYHSSMPFMGGGIRGVDVFFVLSGYLITSLLLAGEAEDLAGFWMRRLARLFPALALFLATYVLVGPLILPRPDNANRFFDAAVSLFYVADHACAAGLMRGLGHMWSLAVEMQFYLAWPFAVRGLKRLEPRTAQRLLLFGWGVVTAARTIAFLITRDFQATYCPSYFHCSGLLLGASLAFVRWPARYGWIGLCVLLELLLFSFSHDMHGGMAWRISIGEVAAAAVLCALVEPGSRLQRAFSWPPLVRVGGLSYGIYLWHHMFTQALVGSGWVLAMSVTLVGGFAGAWVSYHTVERLGRILRRRITTRAAEIEPALSNPASAAHAAGSA